MGVLIRLLRTWFQVAARWQSLTRAWWLQPSREMKRLSLNKARWSLRNAQNKETTKFRRHSSILNLFALFNCYKCTVNQLLIITSNTPIKNELEINYCTLKSYRYLYLTTPKQIQWINNEQERSNIGHNQYFRISSTYFPQ